MRKMFSVTILALYNYTNNNQNNICELPHWIYYLVQEGGLDESKCRKGEVAVRPILGGRGSHPGGEHS